MLETFADSEEMGEKIILAWQESEGEDQAVKSRQYQLGWTEFDNQGAVVKRDVVLAAFLKLMHETIQGMPVVINAEPSRIIHPFPLEPVATETSVGMMDAEHQGVSGEKGSDVART